MKKFLLVCFSFAFVLSAWAQERVVSGKVTSADDGSTLPGVNVVLKGTTNGTVTDANGAYKLTLTEPGGTLVFSFIGLQTQEVTIGDRTGIDIQLTSDVRQLSEVVITTAGGFQAKTREIGTANTLITPQILTAGKAVNIASGLQGKVAGLQINGASSGVNPDYSLVLRGQRSLTGNNQALVVLDNVIVPISVLSNLNANDIDQVVVLNGAGAAALYGSQASNGALIITTKKGKSGVSEIQVSNTTQITQVAFFPKIQKNFGAGGSGYGNDPYGNPTFSYLENQSYGPAFDGVKRPLGPALENGHQDSTTYDFKNGHDKFWQLGTTNQTDFSFTNGDDRSSFYVSGQFVTVTGTTPGDKFNRGTVRVNGRRKIGNIAQVTYNTSYTPNRYDITSQTAAIYDNMLNMPSNVDITKYKNWRTDEFANPNGFYNPWYLNPYFQADTYRQKDRNDYLTGNIELKLTPFKGFDVIARQGIATRNYSTKNTVEGFKYTEFAKHTDASSKTDIPGSVTDGTFYQTQLLTDLLANWNKTVGSFNFNVIGGGQWTQNEAKYMSTGISGLIVKGLYNLSNGTGTPTYSESNYKTRQIGAYGKITIGYKDWFFLTATGRNDWDSRLNANNRSFFYPSVEASVVLSDVIQPIKDSKLINFLKVRGNLYKVGQVNLGNNTNPATYGAYSVLPTFNSQFSNGSTTGNGFPFGSLAGYSQDNLLVSSNLKPEITKGYEFGFDMTMWEDRIAMNATWYHSKTNNQTVQTNVSSATGFSSLLTNVGQTSSEGIEFSLHVTPVKTANWTVTVGGNYTYLHNTVDFISASLPQLSLATVNTAVSAAVAGKAFPVIMGYDYVRDGAGHVIVDANSGLPSKASTISILGNATPKNRLGLDAVVNYKAIRFSVLFEYRSGYKIYNGVGNSMAWSGTGYATGLYGRKSFVMPNSVYMAADGTYKPNTSIAIGNGNGNNGFWTDVNSYMGVDSNYTTSGTFLKLREISLAYSLPTSIFGNSKFIKDATISVQGRNLFLWMAKDNVFSDPEYSNAGSASSGVGLSGTGQTPPVRTYGATLSLKF